MNPWVVSIVIAYLLGSIPTGYLLVRVFRKQDIRAQGSGNIGATNVARSGAKGLGVATLLLDLGKGLAAVLIARRIGDAAGVNSYDVEAVAAIAAVVGHVFPVWLRFRGGKGVATALGVFLALSWPSALCALAVFIVVFAISRYVSLASIAASISLPVFGAFFVARRSPLVIFAFVSLVLLVVGKHHANVHRLMNGTESRFGSKKTISAEAEA